MLRVRRPALLWLRLRRAVSICGFPSFRHPPVVKRPGGAVPPGLCYGVCVVEALLDYGIVKFTSAYPFAFNVIVCVLARPPGGVSVT